MQSELVFDSLSENSLDAHADFVVKNLPAVRARLSEDDVSALVIVLPPAGRDHDGWRRAVAGDLAREYAPKRVNIVSGQPGEALSKLLIYLRDAPGVTGHYAQAHE